MGSRRLVRLAGGALALLASVCSGGDDEAAGEVIASCEYDLVLDDPAASSQTLVVTVGATTISFARGESSGESSLQYQPDDPVGAYLIATEQGIEFVMVAPPGAEVVEAGQAAGAGRPIDGCDSDEVSFLAGTIRPLPSSAFELIARTAGAGEEVASVATQVAPAPGFSGLLTG